MLFYSILIVLAVNIINTLFKFFGYKATKKSNNLEIKYGLLSTKSFILSPSKVQQYTFSQNWIQRKLDIQNVIINQASDKIVKIIEILIEKKEKFNYEIKKHKKFLNDANIFIFGDHGLLQLYKLKRERSKIQNHISELRKDREGLIKEKARLENDLKYIEKLAREKYRMAKPGEKVFKVMQKKEEAKN